MAVRDRIESIPRSPPNAKSPPSNLVTTPAKCERGRSVFDAVTMISSCAAATASCDGSRALGCGVCRGAGAGRATRTGAGRRSMRQLVALTRTARASEPASRRRIASSTLIRPRTGLTRSCHSFASPTLMLTPACRLMTGSAVDRLPLGTSNARSSAACACAGRHSAIAAAAAKRWGERRGCGLSGSISSHRPGAGPSSPTARQDRRSSGCGSCR